MKEKFLSLAPYIVPQVPGCTNLMVEQQLRRAAIQTCNFTHYWKRTLNPAKPDEPTATYRYILAQDEDRNQVEWVQWGDDRLEPISEEQVSLCSNSGVYKPSNTPTHYYELNNRCLRLYPEPHEELEVWDPKQIKIRLSLRPSIQATTMDGGVLQDIYEALINGALGFLLSMSNMDWANPALAEGYIANYNAMNLDLKRRARDGHVMAQRAVRYGGY